MSTDFLNPLRLDTRHTAGKESRGFHQLARKYPTACFLDQLGAGVNHKAQFTRALVDTRFFTLVANIADQARQQGQMHLLIRGCRGVGDPALLLYQTA